MPYHFVEVQILCFVPCPLSLLVTVCSHYVHVIRTVVNVNHSLIASNGFWEIPESITFPASASQGLIPMILVKVICPFTVQFKWQHLQPEGKKTNDDRRGAHAPGDNLADKYNRRLEGHLKELLSCQGIRREKEGRIG